MQHRPIEDLIEMYLNDEISSLEKLAQLDFKERCTRNLEISSIGIAIHSMYVLKDYAKTREYFYKAALCGEYMVRNYDELMDTTIYKICCAVLSDNTDIINRYGTLKNKVSNKNFIGCIFNTAIRSIITDNPEELKAQIEKLKITVTKKGNKGFTGMINVCEGILNNNKILVEQGLKELIKTHGRRGEFGYAKTYFSFEITALAKLAWRKGIEVEVDSPLVPKEMLPVRELDNYIGYEF